MKILVISLLRLGDFIQIAPILAGLKDKYPKADLDVLCHSSCAALQPMLPLVNRWWTINRDELQAGLGRGDIPLLTAFDVLREQCQRMNAEKYDLIINLTQTHFSAWLMGYLESKEKLGLAFSPSGQADFHSPWFRYLDTYADRPTEDVFHFIDVFAQACELDLGKRIWPFIETARGADEVARLNLPQDAEWIAVQALTSDTKKNWGEESWRRWLHAVKSRRPKAHFIFIGAPGEKPILENILREADVSHTLAIVSLEGALVLLNRVNVLVSGDTSIKHLANAASCRIFELAIGSSDYRRTGIYKEGSVIAHAQIACGPCPHSSPCSQVRHACAEQIVPEEMAEAVNFFISRDWPKLRELARSAKCSIRQAHITAMGFWYAKDLAGRGSQETMQNWIDRSAWKFLLEGKERSGISTLGTEIYRLQSEIHGELIVNGDRTPLLAKLDFLEQELGVRQIESENSRREFERLKAEAARTDTIDLRKIRLQQNRTDFDQKEIEIKMKLVQSLKTQLAEKS